MKLNFITRKRPQSPPPDEPRNFRADGDKARDASRWGEAAKLYHLYLAENSGDAEIWVQCGHCEKESGDFKAALSCYLEARSIKADNDDLYLQMGHLYKLMDREADAIESYQKCLSLNNNSADARLELAALLRPAEAVEHSQFAEAPPPSFVPPVRLVLADSLSSEEQLLARIASERADGDLVAVAMLMRALLRLSASDSERWTALAETLHQIGDESQSRRCLTIANAIGREKANLRGGA